jgi:hypothetical protein
VRASGRNLFQAKQQNTSILRRCIKKKIHKNLEAVEKTFKGHRKSPCDITKDKTYT